MNRTLIIIAHPNFEQSSKFNKEIYNQLKQESFDVHVLSDIKNIDIKNEQSLIKKYDNIVLQFPFCWYSMPYNLKYWFDSVLEYNFAFDANGGLLTNKKFMIMTTIGGSKDFYSGDNSIESIFKPIENTIKYIGASYCGSFSIFDCAGEVSDTFKKEVNTYIEKIKSFRL